MDYHVTTAQELQNALTLAAANGADDNIYLAAGYYTGNFNFNSAENRALLLQGEAGTTNTQISIDGAGTGRDMNLANTGTGNFTVRGITFMRNCGSTSIGALRIAGGTGSTLLVDSCRFLLPTNTAPSGIGLEIASGQNATLTNCVTIGNRLDRGDGVTIQGVPGSVSVGDCEFSSHYRYGLTIAGAGSVAMLRNNFTMDSAVTASASGPITFLNNSVVQNSGNGGMANLSGGNILIAENVFRANYGNGGCWANGSSVTLSNNFFTGNVAAGGTSAYGGAATLWGSPIVVSGNSFIGNGVNAGGATAGLVCQSPGALITGNIFSANVTSFSSYGGLYCVKGATITSNSFTGNSPGGLFCGGASTIIGNTFTGNSFGGASLSSSSGSATISANVFKQNSGGGLSVTAPTITLIDNLVSKNTSGSGIYVSPSSTLTMINNTVTDNATTGNGGGLACSVSGVTEVLSVYNNIIWGNSASGNGADVWLAGTGSKKTFLYNDVHGMYGVWDIAANLLDVAPAYFDPVNGDYHLRSTSPCINAGTNGAPSMPALDLDGNARTNASIVDIGAFEFNNTRFHPADVNQDWVLSASEYSAYAADWKNNQTWSSGPNPIPADYVTRAGFLQNQGGTYHNDGAGAPLGWKPGTN